MDRRSRHLRTQAACGHIRRPPASRPRRAHEARAVAAERTSESGAGLAVPRSCRVGHGGRSPPSGRCGRPGRARGDQRPLRVVVLPRLPTFRAHFTRSAPWIRGTATRMNSHFETWSQPISRVRTACHLIGQDVAKGLRCALPARLLGRLGVLRDRRVLVCEVLRDRPGSDIARRTRNRPSAGTPPVAHGRTDRRASSAARRSNQSSLRS